MDIVSLLMIGGMLVVFWLFIVRPQTKAANDAKAFQNSIDKGAKIVTTGGIHGRIIKVDDTSVLMEVDSNVKMRVEKSAISVEMTKAAYPGETEKKTEVTTTKA